MISIVRTAAVLATLVASTSAFATNLVQNGDFEQTTLTSSGQFSNQVTGWTNQQTSGWTGYGYNFLIMSGTADTTGFTSFGGNHDRLWGPNDGSNNGLTASSPSGGNYIAADGDSGFHGAISQTINNLVVGTAYQLTFQWAGAEFYGSKSATTVSWDVSLGSSTASTPTLTNAAQGFTGWQSASMNFVATSTSEVLSFLAQGTPNGEPPTLLLDHVNLDVASTAVPEPTSMLLLGSGLATVGFAARRRRAASAA